MAPSSLKSIRTLFASSSTASKRLSTASKRLSAAFHLKIFNDHEHSWTPSSSSSSASAMVSPKVDEATRLRDATVWADVLTSPLLEMLATADYSAAAIAAHRLLVTTNVVHALGPSPQEQQDRSLDFVTPSVLNENGCPVLLGLAWSDGDPVVRLSIEPLGYESGQSHLQAAEKLCQDLCAAGLIKVEALRQLASRLLCQCDRADDGVGARNQTQIRVSFDLLRCGRCKIKVSLFPHVKADCTARASFDLIDEGVRSVGAAGAAWSEISLSYHRLPPLDRPEPIMISIDCSASQQCTMVDVLFRTCASSVDEIAALCSPSGRTAQEWRQLLADLSAALMGPRRRGRPLDEVFISYKFSRDQYVAVPKVHIPNRTPSRPEQKIVQGLSSILQGWSASNTWQRPKPTTKTYADFFRTLSGNSSGGVGASYRHSYVGLSQGECQQTPRLSVWLNPLPSPDLEDEDEEDERKMDAISLSNSGLKSVLRPPSLVGGILHRAWTSWHALRSVSAAT